MDLLECTLLDAGGQWRGKAATLALGSGGAVKTARAAAVATAWIMKERCLRVTQVASAPASKRSSSSFALRQSHLCVKLEIRQLWTCMQACSHDTI